MADQYEKKKSDAASDQEILKKLQKYADYAFDHKPWIDAKERMITCHQYREGDQWTPEELKVLKERGQPIIVNNQVAFTVNKLVGDVVSNKFRIGYKPRVGNVDEEVAELFSDLNLYIRQRNQLEFEEIEMADDGFCGGFGAMEVYVEFDDLNQPEIIVCKEDSLCVFPDPDHRSYDWNKDAKFIIRAKWFDPDELVEMYPKAKGQINSLSNKDMQTSSSGILNTIDTVQGRNYWNKDHNQVRLIDCEYKTFQRQELVLFDDPQGILPVSVLKSEPNADALIEQAKASNVPMKTLYRTKKGINRGVFIGGLLLEHSETPHKYYSIVPYFEFKRKDGTPYSLIWLALSMQDAINKRESKAMHLLNTNQTIAERSALLDKTAYQIEIHKPDGVAEVADGALANERIILRNNVELAQIQFNMHMSASSQFSRIVGVDPNAGQDTGDLRGNAALKSKFAEIGKPTIRIFDNLKRTRTILGNVIADRIQNYFTAEKTLLITDDQGKAQKMIELTKDKIAKIKTAQYDAVLVDEQDTPNIQQEQWDRWIQALPQIVPLGGFWLKHLIKLSDFRDKAQVLAELEKQEQSGPPPVVPKLGIQAALDQLSPVERAAIWQLVGRDDVAQQIMIEQPMTKDELKATADIAKTKIQANKQPDKKKEEADD